MYIGKKGGNKVAEPKDISNLGIDVSSQYARAQEYFDKSIISDSRGVSIQTSMEVTLPSYATEHDRLFETSQRVQWADIKIPKAYNQQAKSDLFTYSMMPSLGPLSHDDVKVEIITAQMDTYRQALEQTPPSDWQRRNELLSNLDQGQKLLDFYAQKGEGDRDIASVMSRRTQYQRG